MDVLKAEQERKRKLLESTQLVNGSKKFFRKADLEKRVRENEVLLQQQQLLQQHQEGLADGSKSSSIFQQAEKSKSSSSSSSSSSAGAATTATTATAASATSGHSSDTGSASSASYMSLSGSKSTEEFMNRLPHAEVIRRLRERHQPIRLFGETDADMAERLKQLEILEPDVNKGLRNDFMDAIGIVDQEMIDELMQHETTFKEEKKQKKEASSVEAEKLSFADLSNMARALLETDNKANLQLVMKFLKYLLKLWESELDDRDESEKRSMQGKMQSAIFVQTLSYIKPLFRAIKKQEVPEDIAPFLVRIARHMLEREYMKAGDVYLEMAIGNAPWPMGVTMVGIHARTGREKIFAQNIAHVLNDETQRKYIQALKRLMSFCQRKFSTDPSKCVEFVKN